MGMRISGRCDHQGWAANQRQAFVYFVAIDHAVTFGSAGACLERIDNESLHKIDPIGRIKRLPHRPKFGQVAPVGARRGLVDDVRALCRRLPSFGISIRTRRKDQRRDLLRIGGGGLNVRPEQ